MLGEKEEGPFLKPSALPETAVSSEVAASSDAALRDSAVSNAAPAAAPDESPEGMEPDHSGQDPENGAERWEILRGKTVARPVSHLRIHQYAAIRLLAAIIRHKTNSACLAVHGHRVALAEDTVVYPDIAVLCRMDKLSGTEFQLPLLLAEVLERNTWVTDTVLKKGIYETAGVAEYWLVYPFNRRVDVISNQVGGFAGAVRHHPGDVIRSAALEALGIEGIPVSEVFPEEGG